MRATRTIWIAGACLLGAWSAQAQPVYRCGDSYSQQPCTGGTPVQVQDARSAAQGAQTREAALRDAKAADAMEKARLKEEARPGQAYIPPDKAGAAAPAKQKAAKAKPRKPETFTATVPPKPGDTPAKKNKKPKADA